MNAGKILNDIVTWKAHQSYIRGFLIKICVHKKNKRMETTAKLRDQIRILEQKHKA